MNDITVFNDLFIILTRYNRERLALLTARLYRLTTTHLTEAPMRFYIEV